MAAVYANGDLDWLEEWVSRLTWQTVVRLLDLRISGGLLQSRLVIAIVITVFFVGRLLLRQRPQQAQANSRSERNENPPEQDR